jgi:hypothetical protein
MKKILFAIFVSLLLTSIFVNTGVDIKTNEREILYGSLPDLPIKNEKWEQMEKMPNYLDGTILDGNKIVIITEEGKVPENFEKIEYDFSITWDEAKNVADTARQEYIEKYGINPRIPDVEISDEDLNKIIISMKENSPKEAVYEKEPMNSKGGPKQVNGDIIVVYVPAKDSRFEPNDIAALYDDTVGGANEFEPVYNVDMSIVALLGFWSAYDVSGDYLPDLLEDLKEDLEFLETTNYVFMGWVDDASGYSGFAYINDHYCIARESTAWIRWRIAQHEISHCFGAPDHDWSPLDLCVMSYCYLEFWWVGWCEDCEDTIYDQIW